MSVKKAWISPFATNEDLCTISLELPEANAEHAVHRSVRNSLCPVKRSHALEGL